MSQPEDDGQLGPRAPRDAPQPPTLSSREWLARGRELSLPSIPVLRPMPPSRRFTWGWRTGIVLAALLYGGLAVWNRAANDQAMPTLMVVLTAVAALLAVATLVEAWCWAGRPRFSASQIEAITADLPSEEKKIVQRMAQGRGRDIAELRPRAAASAWAQQQNTVVAPGFLALSNTITLAQSSGSVAGRGLGVLVLLITAGVLGWALWLGHRARTLSAALSPDTGPPTVAP